MKFILIFLFSLSAIAQESISLQNPTCSQLKRLDDEGGVLENHPIQHQGSLSTCYANTASIMFFTKFKKENPSSDLKQISWLSLAQANKAQKIDDALEKSVKKQVFDKGGHVEGIYQSIKGKNICGIPDKDWSLREFNHSLETNSYLFSKLIEKYENLFNEDLTEVITNKNSFISPTCFDNINNKFDSSLVNYVFEMQRVPSFENFKKYLKEPVDESYDDLVRFYSSQILPSTFKKGESNALFFLSTENFLAGPDTEFEDHIFKDFIAPEKMKEFKENIYVIASSIAEEQIKILAPLKEKLNKSFISCIEKSLSIDPLTEDKGCSAETQKKSKEIIDFAYLASEEGISPKFIKELLTMNSPLRTKKEVLSKFMQSFYKNCKYKVGTDWQVGGKNKEDLTKLAKEQNQNILEFGYDALSKMINMNLAGRISVKSDFLKRNIKKPSEGTHAMAVIGAAKGCKIKGKENQKCILIQNSYGRKTQSKQDLYTDRSSFPNHMIPGVKYDYTYFDGEKNQTDSNDGFGKFWVCDPEAIEKYITGLGGIQ